MSMVGQYGITGYGGYVPRLRMQRAAIAAAHKWMAPSLKSQGKGERAFCSWDEDSITMAVEAARDTLHGQSVQAISSLTLASTTLPFADLQNSTIVAAALGLDSSVRTLDIGGSQRAGTSGLLAALKGGNEPALFIASERLSGKPASVQEISYGAGAAAFSLGMENIIATLKGSASISAMFVDHFRPAGVKFDYGWEERWIRDEGYMKLVPRAVKAALADAKIEISDINHFILPSAFKGMASVVAKELNMPAGIEADALDERCGFSGVSHGLMMLANVLEKASAGDIILLVGFGQGCDSLILQVTDAISNARPWRGVSGALGDAQVHDAYLRMLSYDNGIDLEWGMRAEKAVKTALTEQYRSSAQLLQFIAGECSCCGTIQFPQLPYCVTPSCNASRENFEQLSLVDEAAKVLTYTADWLSYHPSPPLYVGFVQFDVGARLLMEMVDVGTDGLDVGTPLRMVFRIKDVDKTRGYPRYFWKATPVQA